MNSLDHPCCYFEARHIINLPVRIMTCNNMFIKLRTMVQTRMMNVVVERFKFGLSPFKFITV